MLILKGKPTNTDAGVNQIQISIHQFGIWLPKSDYLCKINPEWYYPVACQ